MAAPSRAGEGPWPARANAASRCGYHGPNEDRVVAMPETGLFAVADGMGGHCDGAGAATETIQRLMGVVQANAPLERKIAAADAGLSAANASLFRRGAAISPDRLSGATVVALLVGFDHACCLWAGDCRLYLWRDERLLQVSQDDVTDTGRLCKAVGAAASIRADTRAWALRSGDVCVLCSDGLGKGMDATRLAATLAAGERNAEHLAGIAAQGGSRDDISAIVVEF